ncbi:MAG: hypothetical protein WCJ37_19355 [Syntrophus sp. (in: bacteria)]
MDWGATKCYLKSETNEKCDYCGCVFRLTVPGQKGHEDDESYHCPECDKIFFVRASNSPTVTKISSRTDGKIDHHNNVPMSR